MAEDKDKDKDKPGTGDGEAAPAARRRGVPALVFVVVGAMVGAAGAVYFVPEKRVEVEVEKPPPVLLDVQHPDLLELTFNPRTEAGKGFASVKLYFVYEVQDDREDAAFESIKAHWDRAKSNCLMLCGARAMRELASDAGKRVLAKDLVDELDRTLFPPRKGDKVARVTEILWSDFILQ